MQTDFFKPQTESIPLKAAIGQKELQSAMDTLARYKRGKAALEDRIVKNELWYRQRHWEAVRGRYPSGKNAEKARIEPTSAWLFNAVANKHADAMDNFPEAAVLPREQGDEQDARSLSEIIPVIMERNRFEQTYSDAWWYKLKMGTAVYAVVWDKSLENGLGDVAIKKLDLLNIFWEPGITDIQKSRNLFAVDIIDDDILKELYPDAEGLGDKTVDVAQYVYDDSVDTSGKSVVVDWYYKKNYGTFTAVHLVKFVGGTLLYSSEDDINVGERGIYAHGKYPLVFDVLYPEEGTVFGFGYVDLIKDSQMYIDKLNQLVLENGLRSGRTRYFYRDNAGVNMEDFADWSKDFVKVQGSLNEDNVREITTKQLGTGLLNLLQYKIEELKETSGNRDVNQGSTSGGVTAAAAIAALQEAGNKLSRDIIKSSYRAYCEVVYLVLELIREFYGFERFFRIEGQAGAVRYISYSNRNIASGGERDFYRKPIFDIKVKPQRANPFSRMAQNELAKELYGAGFFNPQLADQALMALDMMDFEGKEAVMEKIMTGRDTYLKKQAAALMMTGRAMDNPKAAGGKMDSSAVREVTDGGIRKAAENAQTGYAQKIAERAVPSV